MSTLFCEDLPVEAFTLHCLNTEQGWYNRNRMQLFLLETAPAYTSEKKGGKQPKNQFMLFVWGGPELTSGTSDVPSTITTHRSDQFPVRLPRQSFLSHVSQPLFTTYTCKTQKGTCRDTLLHFPSSP